MAITAPFWMGGFSYINRNSSGFHIHDVNGGLSDVSL
jgi:hypothetical protein